MGQMLKTRHSMTGGVDVGGDRLDRSEKQDNLVARQDETPRSFRA
jgi:hypothetical protein